MGQVIGPISPADWLTMLMLKSSISQMRELNDDGRFDIGIRKERSLLYEEFIQPYVSRAA